MRYIRSAFLLAALAGNAGAQARCPISEFGKTCGPQMSASVALDGKDRIVTLMLDRAKPLTFGVMVFGARRIQVPLPNSACDLLVDPAGIVPFATDFSGSSRRMMRVPYAVTPLDAYLQDITFTWDQSQRLVFESANGVRIGPWADVRQFDETFLTSSADAELSGATWGGGKVAPGRLGGSGVLGEFHAADGTAAGKDASDRQIYVWDTDNIVVPAHRTLTGKAITVTNGVLEFTRFAVAQGEAVRFIGSHPARIFATGAIRIEGAVELYAESPRLRDATSAVRGGPAGKGGPGGAPGGRGGDSPRLTNAVIDGQAGGDALVPQGHPRAHLAVGTGGRGSSAHPKSGLDRDIVWISTIQYSRMLAGSGGGGGFATAGGTGSAKPTTAIAIYPYAANGIEFGPPSTAGIAFPLLPIAPSLPSIDQLLIGGAGGGGGGAHSLFSSNQNAMWSPGAGGAGGGGALLLRAGSDVVIDSAAQVSAAGGSTPTSPTSSFAPPMPSPGGAGSGGTVLAQSAGTVAINGEVDVRGGVAGTLQDTIFLQVQSGGGGGGDGYLRVEATQRPDHTKMTKTKPPATAENTGLLLPLDTDAVTGAASRWTDLGFVPTAWHYYVIEANVDGNKVTYSDNPLISSQPAADGEAVVFHLQSATLDANGNPVGAPTPWTQGRTDPVNESTSKGNGFRFFLRLDRRQTRSGFGNVEVLSVRIVVNC